MAHEPEFRIPNPEVRKKCEARCPRTAARPRLVLSELRIRASFELRNSEIRISGSQGGGRARRFGPVFETSLAARVAPVTLPADRRRQGRRTTLSTRAFRSALARWIP